MCLPLEYQHISARAEIIEFFPRCVRERLKDDRAKLQLRKQDLDEVAPGHQ